MIWGPIILGHTTFPDNKSHDGRKSVVIGFECNLEPHSALSACYLRFLSEHQPAYVASSTNRGSGLQTAVPLICDYYKLNRGQESCIKKQWWQWIFKKQEDSYCVGWDLCLVSYYFLNVAFLKTLFIIYYLFYLDGNA